MTEGISPQPQTSSCFQSPETRPKKQFCCSEMRAYQRISFSITHWNLFAGGAFPGHGVAIEAHVLGPQLQQRRPLVVLGAGCPGVGVHHPLGRILPGRSPPIQLEEHKTMSNIPTISPTDYLTRMNVPRLFGCRKHFASRAERESFLTLNTHTKPFVMALIWKEQTTFSKIAVPFSWHQLKEETPENNIT